MRLNPERNYTLAELAHLTGLPGATLRGAAAKHGLGNKNNGTWRIDALDFDELLSVIKTERATEVREGLRFHVSEVRELAVEMDPDKFYSLASLTVAMRVKYSRKLFREVQEMGYAHRMSFGNVKGTMWAARWGNVQIIWTRLKDESDDAQKRLDARVKAPIDSLEEIARQGGHEETLPKGCLKAPSGLVIYPDREYRLARLPPCFRVSKAWLLETCRDAGIVRNGQVGGKGQRCGIVDGKDVIPILRKGLAKGKDTVEPYAVPKPEQVEVPPEVEVEVEPPDPEDKEPVQVYRPDTPGAALDAYRICNMILSRCHGNVARSVVRALAKTHLRHESLYDMSDLPALLKKVESEGGLPDPSTE